MKRFAALFILFGCCSLQADEISHDNKTLSMEFVKIGNPDNMAYARRYGAVSYEYRIGIYEVTVDQWNAVKRADPRINVGSTAPFWKNSQQPAAKMTWFGAAMFCNWLTSGNAYAGAYAFNSSGLLTGIDRASALATYGKVYALPTEDEWVKAAYFSNGEYSQYSNGSKLVPDGTKANSGKAQEAPWKVGSGEINQNGTYDMGGNVAEWTESSFDGSDSLTTDRATRDGSFFFTSKSMGIGARDTRAMDYCTSHYGFRVVELTGLPKK